MESLLQTMVFSLHIDEKFDYDRHVREHPFIIPQPVQDSNLVSLDLDIGGRLCDEQFVAYEELIVIQAGFIAWYQQFQPQFAALMRNFEQKDLPDDALRKIIEYMRKLEPAPIFLGENDGYVMIMDCWLAWGLWPRDAIEMYQLIADWVLNLPFPQVPWESREEEWKDRARSWQTIQHLMPDPMPFEMVKEQEKALIEKPKALDAAQSLVEQMSMMNLK